MSKVPIIDLDALMGKELNDVVCAAYKMGCEQTREVYQKRIEKLEAALEVYSCSCSIADEDDCELGDWANISCGYRARKALEGKDD